MRKNLTMNKNILFLMTVLTINTIYGQDEKRMNIFGINSSLPHESFRVANP